MIVKERAWFAEDEESNSYTDYGPLPAVRAQMSLRAFTNIAVDFAGPFLTKQGIGKTRFKRYLCLFACMNTREVHLEIAYGLDTDSFLNAFYRMTSRRGFPAQVISDNGTNFVGAVRELRQLVNALDETKIQELTVKRGVVWRFNPPSAPHFNGLHEILITAAQRAMFHVMNRADLTDEELMTAIVGAEGYQILGLLHTRVQMWMTKSHSHQTIFVQPSWRSVFPRICGYRTI